MMDHQRNASNICYSDSQIYFWIRQIKCDREDLSNLPKPGRPVDEQLMVSIQKEFSKKKFASTRCVARKINVSHATVLDHNANLIGMKSLHLRLSLLFLTEDQKEKPIKLAKILLNNFRRQEVARYKFVLTGDESWFLFMEALCNDNISDEIRKKYFNITFLFACYYLHIIGYVKPITTKISLVCFFKYAI